MYALRVYQCAADKLVWLAAAVLLSLPSPLMGAKEETYEVLRTKTEVYTNVTVTTKNTNYVFILHSRGMASLRVADLPLETQQELGLAPKIAASGSTNTPAAWAKRELSKINATRLAALKEQVQQRWPTELPPQLKALGLAGPNLIYAILGVMLLLYLFHCYCCMLICRKAGYLPGVLVWLPGLQAIPLLKAADMSAWWFLAFFVPVLNLVPSIMWPFKIAETRGKSVWVAIFLLLPVTSFFAFLYLAFSNGGAADEDGSSESKVMSLQIS